MDLSVDVLRNIVVTLITLVLSIAVHEFGHAFVADRLGDRLPRMEGRVTLNPLAHADPFGTFLFPALFLLASGGRALGFGWGKPVRVNPPSFTRKISMGTGHMLVSLAGPAMNLIFGIVISLVLWGLVKGDVVGTDVGYALVRAVQLNFVLMFFNLLPIPPLDGGTVLRELLPRRYQPGYDRVAQFGPIFLFALILLPQVTSIFLWPATALSNAWLGFLLS
jgi:Zn-dependent protease